MGSQGREVCWYLSAEAWAQPGLEIQEEEKEPGQERLSEIASEQPFWAERMSSVNSKTKHRHTAD